MNQINDIAGVNPALCRRSHSRPVERQAPRSIQKQDGPMWSLIVRLIQIEAHHSLPHRNTYFSERDILRQGVTYAKRRRNEINEGFPAHYVIRANSARVPRGPIDSATHEHHNCQNDEESNRVHQPGTILSAQSDVENTQLIGPDHQCAHTATEKNPSFWPDSRATSRAQLYLQNRYYL